MPSVKSSVGKALRRGRVPHQKRCGRLLVGDQAEVVDKRGRVARTLAGRHVSQEGGFVLNHERYGDRYLESIGTKQANELEGPAAGGPSSHAATAAG